MLEILLIQNGIFWSKVDVKAFKSRLFDTFPTKKYCKSDAQSRSQSEVIPYLKEGLVREECYLALLHDTPVTIIGLFETVKKWNSHL